MRKSKLFLIGAIGLFIIVGVCTLSPLFIVHDPVYADLKNSLLAPEWFVNGLRGHVLGTDSLGRDILSRLLVGGRSSLFISVAAVIPSAIIGTILGLLAGYYSSFTDMVIMRLCDIMMATPSLLLAICIVAVMGSSYFNLIIVLIITSWVITTRIIRGTVLTIRNAEYIQAARVIGFGNMRIIVQEVFPNTLTPLIVNESQHFGAIILVEAAMSFLGMGMPLPAPSWGTMIADGREYLTNAPWVVVVPGIALMLTVLFFNFLGDGLRDVLDPRNRD
jgi:peptide/nickel transport system permease protein